MGTGKIKVIFLLLKIFISITSVKGEEGNKEIF